MAKRPALSFMSILIPILLLYAASPTQAQTFNTPYLNTPTGMVKGNPYTITCSCISVGAPVAMAFKRSDQISSFSGNPTCNIIASTVNTWFCVGEYRFTARTEDNGVNVTCSATQQGDPTPKTDVSPLRVKVPPPSQYPEITGPDTVTANENNTWTCVVDGALPAATIMWRIGATNVNTMGITHLTTKNSEGLFRSSSSISNVFLSSDGIAQIHCDMEHDTGARKTATKNVQVQYKPIITSTPTSYTAIEDVTQRLECTINAVPTATVVGWLKENAAVDRSSGKYSGGDSFTNPDLDIVNPQKEDSGVYICTATNTLGSTNGPDVTVTVRYKPKVSIPNDNYDGTIGGSLTIPCNIDANPGVNTVSWRRLSTSNLIKTLSIPSSGGKYSWGTKSTPSLTINNLDVSDALRYQCVGTNLVGNGESNIVNVIISFAPRNIVLNPADPVINLNEGDVLNLTCSVDAVPTPTITWKAGSTVIGSGSSLIIASARPADNREVTCEVSNSKGQTTKTTRINVSYKPRGSDANKVFRTTVGTALTLTCQVTANPPATDYSWSFGGADLNHTGSSLDVTPEDDSDFGQYTCTATNTVGISDPIILMLVEGSFNGPRSTTTSPGDLTTQRDSEITLATGIGIGVTATLVIVSVILIVIFRRKVTTCLHGDKDSQREPRYRYLNHNESSGEGKYIKPLV